MKTYKKITTFCVLLGLAISMLFISCETTNLELQDNPNELTLSSADPNFVLNSIMGTFGQQHFTLAGIVEPMVRHNHLFGTYANSASPNTMDVPWQFTYAITNNLNFLEDLSTIQGLPQHVGVGQIIEAYAYVNLVDFIGTAVYSQAVNPEFPNPILDDGASIYDAMYNQLDDAIVNLKKENSILFEDIYYNGDVEKWIKLANTLKLRMYVQSKLVATPEMVSNLNAIVAAGNFISDPKDDFVVLFGTNETNPDVRHPNFQQQYADGTNAGNVFQSNDFMNLLLNTKSSPDPRTPFYFYRQDLNDPVTEDVDHCGASWFCYLGDGYDGRDHGDDEGIENDGEQRVAYGIYPSGGALDTAGTQAEETAIATANYDPSSGVTLAEHIKEHLSTVNPTTTNSSNLGGEGIGPFLTASFVHFLLAEAALPTPQGMGATGDSATLLKTAMELSFAKVEEVSGEEMNDADIMDYVDEVMAEYNAADAEGKLNIIAREYYIACFGNSIEAYNLYRRTGYPDLQAHVLASGGEFPRSFFLPSSELTTNSSLDAVDDQKKLTDQVFWDTNPAGFID
ncbi:SusD/RagB family nutrient-binding outer membrane lipoprotein [Seonamhaeicola aphaedonensis]|uniref:SusD-like starch-binding protein associating with outer membrane n=1 Tax=Seonamhaeicola aphaedonensis TaxID=1461338 RepID=A0A3D9HMA7_9FLAO|nr:SusD/RagB family nutrient-binding outer membrane lipoprotein [Seonamhaeicola aphaedonensis]RED50036.1 SusD-like starch-binding protein associating with outer membrane [Seonamhaeicola aphaedonensis]